MTTDELKYKEKFYKLLESSDYPQSKEDRQAVIAKLDDATKFKIIKDVIKLQVELVSNENTIKYKDSLNEYLRWTVKVFANLIIDFGFDLVNNVIMDDTSLFLQSSDPSKPLSPYIPTIFYGILLISIVLFFANPLSGEQYYDTYLNSLKDLLFNMLEENAITGIIYMISKKDLSNLEQSTIFNIYKLKEFDSDNAINTVFIENTQTGYKYPTLVMPYSMLESLVTLLSPTAVDSFTDFVRNRKVFTISNSAVLTYIKTKQPRDLLISKEGKQLQDNLLQDSVETPSQYEKEFKRRRLSYSVGPPEIKLPGGKPKTKRKSRRKYQRPNSKKTKKARKGISVPMRYVPKSLSVENKATQKAELKRSRKAYRSGKGKGKVQYYTRKKMSSFKSKVSPHILKARKVYGIEKITPSRALAKATQCTRATLRRIEQKGQGAYYSSGSRPSQTAHSWGRARLASAITGGKASAVDIKLLEKGCKPSSKAIKMAKKAKGYGQRRVPQVKL